MASKGGKGKEKEKQVKSPPQVEQERPPEREIIPGKITESQWCEWYDADEGVEVVSELVEEVTEIAFSVVYSHYLEEQAFPHSVDDAKHSLLKIIEWQFLSRDEGEVDTQHDPSWIEDEEPLPSSIDSWARGIVQQQSTSQLQSKIDSAHPVHILPFMIDTSATAQSEQQGGEEVTDSQQEKQRRKSLLSETTTSSIASSGRRLQSKPSPSQRAARRPRPQARRPEARMVVLEQPPAIDETDNEQDSRQQGEVAPSVVSSQTPVSFTSEDPALLCRYPMPFGLNPAQLNWQREVTYDDRGNIIDMIKLDPAKFPSRRVKPVVKIVAQHGQYGRSKASTRLQPLKSDTVSTKTSPATASRTHRHYTRAARTNKKLRGDKSRLVGVKMAYAVVGGTSSDDFVTTKESRRFPEMLALPPLIDTIDPVPGVTVREGGRIMCGAKRHQSLQPPTSPRSGMRPVRPLDPHKHSPTQDTLNNKQQITQVT